MTYDLRRLRLTGLIRRIEHTNQHVPTPDGVSMAVFYTKLHNRLLRPVMAGRQPQPHPTSATPCAPSTAKSATTSPARLGKGRVET
jgi:hypothetical protein